MSSSDILAHRTEELVLYQFSISAYDDINKQKGSKLEENDPKVTLKSHKK